MGAMSTSSNMSRLRSGLTLEFPMSLGVYEKYDQAQKAVDYLSDNEFAVQNCMIVGTDLKQVERVTGRLTTGKVAAGGLLSGVWMGVFVGLIFSLFSNGTGSTLVTIVSTALFGAIFGLIWALIGYAATRGRRDFTSVTQVVATRYEVLVEHKLAQQGRELLARMPGGNTAQPLT
jgi:heat induced stress protein YflT